MARDTDRFAPCVGRSLGVVGVAQSTVVTYADADGLERARALATRLGVCCAPDSAVPDAARWLLRYREDRLELVANGSPTPGGLASEFCRGPLGYRVQHIQARGDLLLRTVRRIGRDGAWPAVIDATAGLGRDTFILAAAGATVLPIERDAVVHSLLADGLLRARTHQRTSHIAARVMEPICDDACRVIADPVRSANFDLVYIDPMFADGDLGGKAKKEMQVLRQLLGVDQDGVELLQAALQRGSMSVVVKRGRRATFLGGIAPARSTIGRSVRFDVYTPQSCL